MKHRLLDWNPFTELNRVQKRLASVLGNGGDEGNALDETSNELMSLQAADWQPAVDISEDDKEYLITADLPEVKKEEVNVGLEDGILTISGERKSEVEEKDEKKKFHRVERSYGRYIRTFRLPDDVEGEKIAADFKNGVLHVHLPKGAIRSNKKLIEVA